MPRPADETRALIDRSGMGDVDATAVLTEDLYGELRDIAARMFTRECRDHTLQATAVVHEAWLRIAGVALPQQRTQFLALAAHAMRNVLVDHARRRHTKKRGGGTASVALDHVLATYGPSQPDLLALDEALQRLAVHDGRCARIVELRYFAGMTLEETGAALAISTTQTHRLWEFARAWLRQALGGASADTGP